MSNRPDTVDLHATVAERVRKLEVMPNPRTINAPKWRPTYEDAYAIAGHIYMLGCFDQPLDPDLSGEIAYVSQAAQYLWAALDQQGFRSRAEGEDWTLFLKRMGALPFWSRYQLASVDLTADALAGELLSECRPAQAVGPWVRTAYAGNGSPPPLEATGFQDRALYWHGLPHATTYDWITEPEFPVPYPYPWEISEYYLWDGTGPYDRGVFKSPFEPSIQEGGEWYSAPDPAGPEHTHPCFLPDLANPYIAGQYPGIVSPYSIANCPTMPPGTIREHTGSQLLARLVFPAHDLSLISPPRIMSTTLKTSDYWHPILVDGGVPFHTGPGLAWLAEGAETILPEHPHVSRFYSDYLPIAYNNKLRAHHYNWQQLEVGMSHRGRVEAHKEPDRVILKGRLHAPADRIDRVLFKFPDDWPVPAASDIQGRYLATSDQGPIPVHSGGTFGTGLDGGKFYIVNTWVTAHPGPVEISLDGMVIPLALPAT